MRKCAAILCAALLTVSACACGKDTDPVTKTTVHRITTTTTTTPVKDYTDIPGKAPLNLTYATSFSDGVAFVRYLDTGVVSEVAIALLPFGIDVGDRLKFENYEFTQI